MTVLAPHVLDRLAQAGRRVDRGIGDEAALAQIGGVDRAGDRLQRVDRGDRPAQAPLGDEERRRGNDDGPQPRRGRHDEADQRGDDDAGPPPPPARAAHRRGERDDGQPRRDQQRGERRHADQRQRQVQRAEHRHQEEHVAGPRARVHERPVPGIERGQQRQDYQHGEEDRVGRRQRGGRPVGRQQEEQHAVVERLDRVLGGGEHEAHGALLGGLQRLAHLDEDGHQQPQQ